MQTVFLPFTGTLDTRSPRDAGDTQNDVWLRENFTVRDGITRSVSGTEKLTANAVSDPITWMGRYYSDETGVVSPKGFAYSQNGKIYNYTDLDGNLVDVGQSFAKDAYPKHWFYKLGVQTYMFLVDGVNLWSYNGNNDYTWVKETLEDNLGESVKPIDVIEHKDRLCVLSAEKLFISANLAPTSFTDPTDSLEIVVGSGKGHNMAFGKIKDTETLFILNTEGIFALAGDTISAVASTFEIRIVDEGKCVASGSVVDVERAILYVGVMGNRYELFAFDGSKSEVLTYKEQLHERLNPYREMLNKMVATYEDNYYKLSFVENGGKTYPDVELWWDALEKKCTIIRGRAVGSYMKIDITQEMPLQQFGRSDTGLVMWGNRSRNFDGSVIVLKWRTKDIKFSEDRNVRIMAFRPKITPSGNKNIAIKYYLDGRLSKDAAFNQNLEGENISLGLIEIANQPQVTDRIRPKVLYSRGKSITFDLYLAMTNMGDGEVGIEGIGIDFISKPERKGKKVGA